MILSSAIHKPKAFWWPAVHSTPASSHISLKLVKPVNSYPLALPWYRTLPQLTTLRVFSFWLINVWVGSTSTIFVKIQQGLWYFAANLFAINPAILGSILPG